MQATWRAIFKKGRKPLFAAWLCICLALPQAMGQGGQAPMELARTYDAHCLPQCPPLEWEKWLVSEKYDGVRVRWDGQRLYSRGGHVVHAPAWFTQGWPRMALEGELWAGRGRFAQAQSAAARQSADEAWRSLRVMVFDAPAHGGPGTPFSARLAALQAAVAQAKSPYLQAAPQRTVQGQQELKNRLDEVLRGGGEGLMLRRADAPWQAGRSPHLLKLKPHEDAEARVLAHLPGRGRHAGRLGALLVETPDGRRFRLGSGLKDADRDHPPPVGAWVTYRFRGLHEGSGLPRFATFVRVRQEGF